MIATKDNILEWLKVDNLEPLSMFWYPSTVDDIIIELDVNWDEFNELEQRLFDVGSHIRNKIKEARQDGNKQVMEFALINAGLVKVYIGWKDSLIQIGWGGHNRDGGESHPVDFEIN